MSNIALTVVCCGAVAAFVSSGAAQAQSAPAQSAPAIEGGALEEVVVTASRAETNLQTTPIAVTAISSDELARRNVTSLLDVANFVPSLSIGSRSGTGVAGGSISIRGMGVDATDSSAAVGTYVDDVYFASGRGNILGMMDLDRVEVLRGPQGTLFGRNTIAGAIQYVTRKPDNTFGGYLEGTVGNYNREDVQGALNIPLGDTFALRVSGLYNDRDGYVRDLYTGQNRGSDRTQAGRIRALWTPTDRLTIDLKGEALDEYSNGRAVLVDEVNPLAQFPGLAFLFGETRPLNNSYLSSNMSPGSYTSAGFNAPDYFRFSYDVAQGTVTYRISDTLSLKSITADANYRSRLSQDLDNTPLSILWVQPAHDDTQVFTEELQLSGRAIADALRFTVGAYYYDSQERQDPGEGIVLGLVPQGQPFGNPALDVESTALYGQATYKLTERLSATLGLRYSRETNKSWLIAETAPLSQTFSNVSPHFGLDFQLTPDTMLYAKASQGFRAGGFTANLSLPGGGNAFSPETAWTYEAGARMEFLDHRLRVNPTVFLTDWKDIQFNKIVPTSAATAVTTANAGDARIKGFELETQFAATRRLQLNATLSLLNAYYTRVENLTYATFPFGFLASFPDPVTGQVLPGSTVIKQNLNLDTPLQRAPKTKFSVGALYSYPLPGQGKLTASVDYSWTDTQQSAVTISDQVQMPSYGLLNARLQYDAPGGRWSIAAFGTNLTNEYYLIGGVDFAGGYTTGTRELDPGRPREYGTDVRVHF